MKLQPTRRTQSPSWHVAQACKHKASTALQCTKQQPKLRVHTRPGRLAAAMQTAKLSTHQTSTMQQLRKAWHITRQGDMSSLRLITEPIRDLQPGEVLVEVRALGLNFADVFCCLGLYKAAPKGDFIPGLEFSGVVLEAAPQVFDVARQGAMADAAAPAAQQQQLNQPQYHLSDQQQKQLQQQQRPFKPGDCVLGVLRFGAFASHVVIPAPYLRLIPDNWTFEEGAAFPVQTLTAAYGLFECGNLQQGQAVLVQSAAGGVGLQALQILSRYRATVFGLVGSQDKVRLLSQRFCNSSHTVNRQAPAGASSQQHSAGAAEQPKAEVQQQSSSSRSSQVQPTCSMEFAMRVDNQAAVQQQLAWFLQHTGRQGFDIILDSLGGSYFKSSYEALKPCGRHVIFGAGSLTPKPGLRLNVHPSILLAGPSSLIGLIKLAWDWLQRPRLDVLNMPGDNKGVVGFNLIWLYARLDLLADLYDKVDALVLDAPLVGRVFKFEQLPEALSYLQSGASVGKVVVSVHHQSR